MGTCDDAAVLEVDIDTWQEKGMNRMKKVAIGLVGVMLVLLLLTGCSGIGPTGQRESNTLTGQETDMGMEEEMEDMTEAVATKELQQESTQSETAQPELGPAVLLYQGQASIRIITDEGKVIYIDPYAGDDYGSEADLILVTHSHFDHNQTDKVENRNPDCQIITQNEAIREGEHQIFELGYVIVEAMEAGYNPYHDVNKCVGYVLTFSNGKSVYVTGDTSKTEQMPLLSEKEIDYAFFCCDGVYNMGLEEAAECAKLVGAKHNIPYHMTTNTTGRQFDRAIAEQFDVENRLIVEDGEEILIE